MLVFGLAVLLAQFACLRCDVLGVVYYGWLLCCSFPVFSLRLNLDLVGFGVFLCMFCVPYYCGVTLGVCIVGWFLVLFA